MDNQRGTGNQMWTESQPVSGSESQDSMKALGEEFTLSNYSSSCEDGLSPSQEDTPSLSMSEFSSRSNSATVPLITAACSPLPMCPQPDDVPSNKTCGYGAKGLHKNQAHRDPRPWVVKQLSKWRQHVPSNFKKECKLVVDIAWPVIVTQFLQFTLQLTSAVFCGHLGEIYLDAIALGNLVVNTCGTSVLIGLGCACDTLFAQTFGSANKKKMGIVLQRGLMILLLSCLPCWALLINTENLLSLTGQDKHIARLAGQFAMVSISVLPGEAIHLVLTKYLHSQSIVVPSMVIFFVVNLANFGLHAVLIFGLGLGVVGAAISVSLSHWLVCILHVIFIKLSRVYISTWDGWQAGCFYRWADFLRLALPGLFMICLQWWCFEIFTVLAGLLSPEELAAHSIVYQLGAFLYMVPLGVSVSVCIRVGNCLGAGNPTAAINTAKAAMGLAVIWSIVMAALFLGMKDYCSYAFTNDRWVGEVASSLVPIMCLLQIGDAIQCVGAGVVLGCGNQRLGAAIHFVSYYCVATPLASILMFKTSLRIVGAWWGLTLCTICQAVAFSLVLLKTDWHKTTLQVQIQAGIKNMSLTKQESGEEKVVARSAGKPGSEETEDSLEGAMNRSFDLECNPSHASNKESSGGGTPTVTRSQVVLSAGEVTVRQLVLRRSCALAVCLLVLGAGIAVNLSVSPSNNPPSSCILVSGSEVNETWMSFQIHHRESFLKMSPEDQRLLNLTFWYEMSHHWNKTFLYCGETIIEPENANSARSFNLSRIYSHLAMASRPSG